MGLSLPTQSCPLITVATKRWGEKGIFLLGGIISCLACKLVSPPARGTAVQATGMTHSHKLHDWCPVRVVIALCSASAVLLLLLFNVSLQRYCFVLQQQDFLPQCPGFPPSSYIYSWSSGKKDRQTGRKTGRKTERSSHSNAYVLELPESKLITLKMMSYTEPVWRQKWPFKMC